MGAGGYFFLKIAKKFKEFASLWSAAQHRNSSFITRCYTTFFP